MKNKIRSGCQLFLGGLSAGLTWLACSPWRSFLVLFLLSFLRLFIELDHLPDETLIPTADREFGAVAISLMQTGRFADPYVLPTGPTAHLPPLYPFLVSLVYRWFGLTPSAGYVTRLLIAITISVLYALLPWLAGRFGLGRQSGFLAGLAANLAGVEWYGNGEYLAGLVLALLLFAFHRRWTRPHVSWYGSLLLGLAIGAAFHLHPVLLTVVLGCFAFELWWNRDRRSLASLGICALGILVACVPWAWRNYSTFHSFFFIRSNLGLELRIGNHAGAAATFDQMDADPYANYLHPRLFPAEAARVQELGEVEYMNQAGRDALEWISTHPGGFLWLSVQRFVNFWGIPLHRLRAGFGLMLLTLLAAGGLVLNLRSLAIPQRAILLIPLATYPLIYYLVAYMSLYRVPIDWILFLLAGSLVWKAISGFHLGQAVKNPGGSFPTA